MIFYSVQAKEFNLETHTTYDTNWSSKMVCVFHKYEDRYWFRIRKNSSYEVVRLYTKGINRFRLMTARNARRRNFIDKGIGLFLAFVFGNTIVIIKPNFSVLFLYSAIYQNSLYKKAMRLVDQFKSKTKDILLHELSTVDNGRSSNKILMSFTKYMFCDEYSAWIYNSMTQAFTRLCGSIKCLQEYADLDLSPIFQNAVERMELHSNYRIEAGITPDIMNANLRFANVVWVSAPDNKREESLKLLILFYSKHTGLIIQTETVNLLRSILERDLAGRFFDRFIDLNSVKREISAIELEWSIKISGNKITQSVCKFLGWESCAMFIYEKQLRRITRISLGTLGMNVNTSEHNEYYQIDSKALTTNFINQPKLRFECSYDIENDPRNSRIVNDPTITKPRNWLAVPIRNHTGEFLGVIRCKNKVETDGNQPSQFCSIDIHNLIGVAEQTANLIDQKQTYKQRQELAEKRKVELEQATDYMRTFRHEVRTPISSFLFAPDRIIELMHTHGMIEEDTLPKEFSNYFRDFRSTAARLEWIVKSLTLNPEEVVKEKKYRNIYLESIAPVLAFAKPYARRRRRIIHENKNSLLNSAYSDSIAISMAFHALIENAIKYSDKDSYIEIYGEVIDSYLWVRVLNKTSKYHITEEEKSIIFEKYVRGKAPMLRKMEGTGIGLFLVKRIVELHGGKVSVEQNGSIIVFSFSLPVRYDQEDRYENSHYRR